MITVLIPTYNRPLCIKDIIEKSINPYNGKLFCFQIHDSSESNETKLMVDSLSNKRIDYFKHNKNELFFEKAVKSIKYCRTEYFYLLGDGNIVDFNNVEQDLLLNNYADYDLIGINNCHEPSVASIFSFNNLLRFSKRFFTKLTYWGFSIVKTSGLSAFLSKEDLNKYNRDTGSWWLGSVILRSLLQSKGNSLILNNHYISISQHKNDHSWTNGERYYRLTFQALNKTVMELPSFYDEAKLEMISAFRKDNLATRSYLVHLRRTGTITLKRTIKYKKDIKLVKGFYFFMVVLSLTPTFLIKFVALLRRKNK